MTFIDSPAAARRRLRLALRKAREATQLTQGEVAESLEWSISKVNRIENGEVTISGTDLRALMALLAISDTATVDELLAYGRAARRRGWWDEPFYRTNLTPAMLKLIQYESEAAAIRCFQPTLFPGLLQLPAYADAVMDFWAEIPAETRQARSDSRTRRRREIFERPEGPPKLLVLLDESVLMRELGGPHVLLDQLTSVLRLQVERQLVVRVVPLAEGATIAQVGGFTIFDLIDEEDAILYREAPLLDDLAEGKDLIARYRHVFEQAWHNALSTEASVRLVEARIAAVRVGLDRSTSPGRPS